VERNSGYLPENPTKSKKHEKRKTQQNQAKNNLRSFSNLIDIMQKIAYIGGIETNRTQECKKTGGHNEHDTRTQNHT
jgi:hypothetical protein